MNKINFKNYPDTSTPLSAENLNKMQNNIDNSKVEKVEGKGLSTKDFKAEYETKLNGIASGANKTIIVNDLTSTSTTSALSANQGRILDETINKLKVMNNSELKINTDNYVFFNPQNVQNYENYGNCFYYKIGTKVHLHIGVHSTEDVYYKIFTLPIGYRPSVKISSVGIGGALNQFGGIQIDSEGNVAIYPKGNYFTIDLEYEASN